MVVVVGLFLEGCIVKFLFLVIVLLLELVVGLFLRGVLLLVGVGVMELFIDMLFSWFCGGVCCDCVCCVGGLEDVGWKLVMMMI